MYTLTKLVDNVLKDENRHPNLFAIQ